MPRMSKEAKAASHAKILKEASRLFREHGIEATGLADIMSSAGMTHGGFYRHFKSKNELVCASIKLAINGIVDALERDFDNHGARDAIRAYVDLYLSQEHVHNRGAGCPLAALSEEIGRGPASFQAAMSASMKRLISLLAKGLEENPDEAEKKAVAMLSMLMGTVILARSASSNSQCENILSAGRKSLELFFR